MQKVAIAVATATLMAIASPAVAGDCQGPGRQLNTERGNPSFSEIGGRLLLLRFEDDPKPYLVESDCLRLNSGNFWFNGYRSSSLNFAVVNYVPGDAPVSAAIMVQALRELPATAPVDEINIYRNNNWLDVGGAPLPPLPEERLTPGLTLAEWNAAHAASTSALQVTNDGLGRPFHAWLVDGTVSSWDYRAYLRADGGTADQKIWLTTELIRFGVNTTPKHKSFIPFYLGIEGEGELDLNITSTISGFDHRITVLID